MSVWIVSPKKKKIQVKVEEHKLDPPENKKILQKKEEEGGIEPNPLKQSLSTTV